MHSNYATSPFYYAFFGIDLCSPRRFILYDSVVCVVSIISMPEVMAEARIDG